MPVKIVAASDHAGLRLREEVVKVARGKGYDVEDLGTLTAESVDYPDYAQLVGERVAAGRAHLGLLVCGTGIGMCMAANKVKGVRAAHCCSELEARLARQHNGANVLCLGERIIGLGLGAAIAAAFLDAAFEGGRHQQRVDKIDALHR